MLLNFLISSKCGTLTWAKLAHNSLNRDKPTRSRPSQAKSTSLEFKSKQVEPMPYRVGPSNPS